MNSKVRMLKVAFPLTLSFSVLAACGPAPITSTPSPNPTASASTPVATPTPAETASPTSAPVATPTPVATASATPTSGASSSATASPSTPLASATSDISVVEKTTFNGKVYDDTNAPLDGVTVVAKSLNNTLPYDATTTTAGGAYAFNNAPAGVQLEITASKPGFTTRRRVEVLKSNKDGDPNANKYDFGSDTTGLGLANALSDKPEVIAVTPGRNASGVSPTTSFVLKFSEPMDRATVVDNIQIRAFSTEQLSVDNQNTMNGSNSIADPIGTSIWDKSAFNVSWNSDDSEATFTFKEERALPTDKDSDKAPDYAVAFSKGGFFIAAPVPVNNSIKDKAGISRNSNYFKLTEGNFEESYKFTVTTETTKPRVDSIVAQTAENSGASSEGDVVRVRFSERMVHYTLQRTIAGGINNVASQAPAAVTDSQNNSENITAEAAAANYRVTVMRGTNPILNQVAWSSLGGRAIYDTSDATHKTVLLLPGMLSTLRTITAAPVGQMISVTHHYVDGTSETIEVGPVASNAESAAGLLLFNTVDPDTVTGVYGGQYNETVNNNDILEPGETYYLTLGAGARKNDNPAGAPNGTTNGKLIAYTVINPTGAFSSSYLNAPAGGYVLFPGTTPGGRPDIYKPGDNVMLEVNTTIVDPAGNTLDSAGDDASANAS